MNTDQTVVSRRRQTPAWVTKFWVAQCERDIVSYERRIIALESDMSIDMLHGLSDATEIGRYYDAHVERERLLARLADAQDALRQLLA